MGCKNIHINSDSTLRLAYLKKVKKPLKNKGDYYTFGLKHQNYNSPVKKLTRKASNDQKTAVPAVENPYNYKYNNKELQEEFDLNVYDYGARNYDASLGRWFNPDPLADAYFGLTPYAYVANSPILLIDPDGKRISFNINYDDQGSISGVTIAISGKVIDNTKKGNQNLSNARQKVLDGISNIKITGNGVDVKIVGHIGIAKSEKDLDTDDHAFRLVDDVSKAPGVSGLKKGLKALGFGPKGENVVYLDKNFTSRTAAHEIGHSAGLSHIKDSSERSLNLYRYNFLRNRARNLNGLHSPAEVTGYKNSILNMSRKLYSTNDYFGNLMHQSSDTNSQGKKVAGYKITREQINTIRYLYENGNINKGKQN